jgi:hypothetical protein
VSSTHTLAVQASCREWADRVGNESGRQRFVAGSNKLLKIKYIFLLLAAIKGSHGDCAARVIRLRIKHVHLAERQLFRVKAGRILMKQVAEIAGGALS